MIVATMLTALILLAGTGVGAAQEPPQVHSTYQSTIDDAWSQAVQGENPTNDCAGIKGAVLGRLRGGDRDQVLADAASAIEACNVTIPIRYFSTLLERVESGDEPCMTFMTEMMRGIAAMTIEFEDIETPEGEEDPEQRIKDALRPRAEAACPNEAPFVFR